jgi:TetR/AcrR family fatty acid metabolism transcriptional regulator
MNEHSFKELINLAAETKNDIRKAAVEVISIKGFHNTRMQDIADKAELAVGTLYNYFSSKDEILEYIFEMEMKNRMEIMKDLKEENLKIKELLREFLTRHYEILIRNPHLGRVVVREKDFSRREKVGEIKKFMQTLIKNIEEIFKNGVERGEIKDIDPHLMAVFFFGAIHGIIEHALTEPEIEMLQDAPDFIMQRIDHIFI